MDEPISSTVFAHTSPESLQDPEHQYDNWSPSGEVVGQRRYDAPRARQVVDPDNHGPILWTMVGAIEQILASAMFLLILPALALIGLIIFALSRESPLVAHLRVGHGGKAFWVLKFRTMWATQARPRRCWRWLEYLPCESVTGKPRNDPRVTSVFAAICRRYSLDELPQLWQVATGEMALIGPRPMTSGELTDHYGSKAAEVLRVKPGLTGLWQVNGRSRLNYDKRRRLDLFLVRHRSPALYLKILVKTIPRVISGKDAW